MESTLQSIRKAFNRFDQALSPSIERLHKSAEYAGKGLNQVIDSVKVVAIVALTLIALKVFPLVTLLSISISLIHYFNLSKTTRDVYNIFNTFITYLLHRQFDDDQFYFGAGVVACFAFPTIVFPSIIGWQAGRYIYTQRT
ncbi:hypothetical protein N9Y92_01745 [Chlamydiales bacterium]|nr:hypothetical protein [Chlamydiales bacterium]